MWWKGQNHPTFQREAMNFKSSVLQISVTSVHTPNILILFQRATVFKNNLSIENIVVISSLIGC